MGWLARRRRRREERRLELDQLFQQLGLQMGAIPGGLGNLGILGGLNGIGQPLAAQNGYPRQAGGFSPGANQANYAAYYSLANLTTTPAKPLERAGIPDVGELVGWRIWWVRPKDRLLVSYS